MHYGVVITIALIIYLLVIIISLRCRQYHQRFLDINVWISCTKTFSIYIHSCIISPSTIRQRMIFILFNHTKAISHTRHQQIFAIITRKMILDSLSIFQTNNLSKDIMTVQVCRSNNRVEFWIRFIGFFSSKDLVGSNISIETIVHILHNITLPITIDVLDDDAFAIFFIYSFTFYERSCKSSISF